LPYKLKKSPFESHNCPANSPIVLATSHLLNCRLHIDYSNTTTMAKEKKKHESNIMGGNNTAQPGDDGIVFVDYKDESSLEDVDRLVACDLSEPYSIFTYRYFLNRFPDLCILAFDQASGEVCGCVVGKIDSEEVAPHAMVEATDKNETNSNIINKDNNAIVQTGYIGMLAVSKSHRRKGIGKDLVRRVLKRMKDRGCESVTLETEVSNVTAQKLYQNYFGFIREELLVRYYLNCGDAYRLRLWF